MTEYTRKPHRLGFVRTSSFALFYPIYDMNIIDTIITELIQQLANTNIAQQSDAIVNTLVQLLSLIGLRNQARDLQSAHAYYAALAGSQSAAQWLLHNSDPNSGMPAEDIKDAQHYWPKLEAAGWTNVNGTATPPAKAVAA